MKRRPKRSKGRMPQQSVIRTSGGKRKRSLSVQRQKASLTRAGNVTREMLENAPDDAEVVVNSRGVVKMIIYTRES